MLSCDFSSTVPTSSPIGAFTTSAPTTTTCAANSPGIWGPNQQVVHKVFFFLTCPNSVFNMFLFWMHFQRTKNISRSTAGLQSGTWRRTTTTREHGRSGKRRTTCRRSGRASVNGCCGIFRPPLQTPLHLPHRPHPQAPLLSFEETRGKP